MLFPPVKQQRSLTIHTERNSKLGLESQNNFWQTKVFRFLIYDLKVFTINGKTWLFWNIFEVLTKSCKSLENKSENLKIGSWFSVVIFPRITKQFFLPSKREYLKTNNYMILRKIDSKNWKLAVSWKKN